MTEGWLSEPDSGGSYPNQWDLQHWAEIGGATHPVLADPDAFSYFEWENANEVATSYMEWPRMRLVAPGMSLKDMSPDPTWFDISYIETLILQNLP